MSLSFIILIVTGISYLFAFLMHLWAFISLKERDTRPALILMKLGFLLSTFYFASEAVENKFFLPVANVSEAMAFFAWSLAFVYLVLLTGVQSKSFGLILTPVLLALIAAACLTFHGQQPPFEGHGNAFFLVHILSAFFAYACFAISFAAGILYLIQNHELKSKKAGTFYHKLPSLEELEKLIYQPMFWGIVLLLMAVGIGFVWSQTSFGEIRILDPKTIATIMTAIIYMAIVWLRYGVSMRAKQGALLSLLAFMVVLFSFVGPRFIAGSHYY